MEITDIKLVLEYTKSLRVLYVEDNFDLLTTTKELLENFFHTIDVANDGREGLDRYLDFHTQNSEHYDIVITDIKMPNMDGIEMSSEIMKINSMQSIIITTAHNDIAFLSSALHLGIDGFITKPISHNTLMQVLYKSSQAISDHKFVLSHVEMIEDLNMQLETSNRELLNKNTELEKSLRVLDTMVHKEQLSSNSTEVTVNTTQDTEQIREQIQHLVQDDLYELIEIHTEIDLGIIHIINCESYRDSDLFTPLIGRFLKYASILSFYNFFNELSGSMTGFARILKESPLPEDDESIKNIFMLLESFMYVLGKWQSDLASGNEDNINSLDASMISDMNTIINMWTQKVQEVTEDDLDDIFDF